MSIETGITDPIDRFADGAEPVHSIAAKPVRVVCVNSGFLGHRSVARLVDEILSREPRIDAAHLEATGLLVAPDSVDELAAAMTRLVDDPVLRHRFGRAARERAERLYAPADYTARLVGLLLAAQESPRTNNL